MVDRQLTDALGTPGIVLLGLFIVPSTFVSAAPRVYDVGGVVKAPIISERPPIDFSKCELQGKRLSGSPIGEVVVTEEGRVASVKLLKGVEPCIDRMILQNLRAWKFKPGTRRGRPVAVRITFSLYIHYR